jgi:enamine deaminase RidA (YjgF/YER057c/UK114 family)
MTEYHTDYPMLWLILHRVLFTFLVKFLADSRSALTSIGVASLASPETLVEIEATAALK